MMILHGAEFWLYFPVLITSTDWTPGVGKFDLIADVTAVNLEATEKDLSFPLLLLLYKFLTLVMQNPDIPCLCK